MKDLISSIITGRNEVRPGNVFTDVYDSVHRGGSASVHAGIPPEEQTPPSPTTRSRPPPEQTPPPPGADTPHLQEQTPSREADSSIQSTSGRYASYWNAFLCSFLIDMPSFFNPQASNVFDFIDSPWKPVFSHKIYGSFAKR